MCTKNFQGGLSGGRHLLPEMPAQRKIGLEELQQCFGLPEKEVALERFIFLSLQHSCYETDAVYAGIRASWHLLNISQEGLQEQRYRPVAIPQGVKKSLETTAQFLKHLSLSETLVECYEFNIQ